MATNFPHGLATTTVAASGAVTVGGAATIDGAATVGSLVIGSVVEDGLVRLSVPLGVTANSTVITGVFCADKAYTVSGVDVAFVAPPASTSGTVTLALDNYDLSGTAADGLLVAATYDLETPTANTVTALVLTATAADLVLAAGDYMYATVISNNADMTGGTGGVLMVTLTPSA